MTKAELLEKANSLPLAPGVYLMHGKDGGVIYVGKAKKLKNRVSQYFQENRGHDFKTQTMVGQVDDFETIIVRTEFEALVLENALIKQYMPRYNILLKDDKGYPFVRLTRETYPRFSMVSRPAADGLALAAGADHDGNARRMGQHNAGPVLDGKLFQLVAGGVIVNAAVGHGAVHIQNQQPDHPRHILLFQYRPVPNGYARS